MQISCPKCTKIFDVNEDLIPKDGRFVQCGNCENKWFYKKQLITTSKTINKINKDKKIEKKEFKIKEKVLDTKPKIKEKNKQIKKENINLYKNYSFSEKNKKNKIKYFKL